MTHSRHSHRLRRDPRGNGKPALRWHRRIGLALAAVFLVVCATGFLLNHAEAFGLRAVPLRASGWYRWYGMQPKGDPIAYRCGPQHAVWLDGNLYLDTKPVARIAGLRGAAALPPASVAAAPREIVLFTATGELIERLDAAALPPGPLARIGVLDGTEPRLVAEVEGGRRYVFDEGFLGHRELETAPAAEIAWSTAEPTPPALRDAVLVAHRGEGLTLHRLVLDLHSGRFFGSAGPYVVDAAAVGLLFLTASGVYTALWGSRRRERPAKHR